MSIHRHLMDGERVLGEAPPFYATTHRVLRYEEAPDGIESISELIYNRIASVERVSAPNHKLMIGGTLMVLAGLFLGVYIGLYTPYLAVPAGLAVIIFGAIGGGMPVCYRLESRGASPEEQAKWLVPYRGSMQFIATVGDRSGHRPAE